MKNRKIQILALIGIGALVSGCGQQAYRADDSSATPSGQASGGNSGNTIPNIAGTGTGTITGTGTGVVTGTTGTVANNAPNSTYSYRFSGTGSYTSPSVHTDSVLKVTVTATSPTNISGTGWTGMYNCEQVTVTVLGSSQTVLVARAGYYDSSLYYFGFDPCSGAQTSATLDFSDRLGSGHNSVNIKVSEASVDNCRQWNAPQSAGCPINVLYDTYSVSGKISVQTNTVN